MFANLASDELKIVVDAMEINSYKSGDHVID